MKDAVSRLPAALLLKSGARAPGCVIPPVDHDGPQEGDVRLAVLVVARGLHLDDAHPGPRTGLARLQYLAPGVDRVALEDGGGEAHLVPSQVGEDVLRDVRDALA